MIALWDFYWPVFTAGVVLGVATGWLAFYGKSQTNIARLVTGAALSVAAAALWHGPLGAGDRLASSITVAARAKLDRLELPFVTARVVRGPLGRTLVLTGPADTFQRRELPRYMAEVPGVDTVRWAHPPAEAPR